jgi:hypothetical protein
MMHNDQCGLYRTRRAVLRPILLIELCAALSLSLAPLRAIAESQRAILTAPQLSALLKDSNIKISATSTTVVGTGPAVTVVAEEDPKSADQDLKIDAIFLSKALIEAAPSQISTVKVLFSQIGKPGRYISIGKDQISEYGSGKVTAPQLLTALHLKDVEPEKAPAVQPGLEFDHRLLTWKRINRLKQTGTGVKPFESIFQEVEGLAKSGDADKLEQKLAYLDSKLAEQEEQIALIRKAARGHGVPASPTADRQTPAASTAAASAPSMNIDYIPPNAEGIRRDFSDRAEDAIRQTDARNHTGAQRLRALKQQIDECFSKQRQGNAFALIHEFVELVKQQTGMDILGPGGQGQGGPGQGGPGQGGQGQGGQGQGVPGQGGQGQGGPGQGGPGQGGPGPSGFGAGGPGQDGPR